MNKIRVFLVDDASVVRRLVPAALNRDSELEVVGVAADGQMALSRLAEAQPDVVLLDLEMPVMDGLQTLLALRESHPRLPVIMFSRFTQRGVEATVRALTLGADDYVPKPGDGVDFGTCIEELLIPKIKLLGRRRSRPVEPYAPAVAATCVNHTAAIAPSNSTPRPLELVVIGASTGGPNALVRLLTAFPTDWSIPIVIVQHMPAGFTARLAERLSEKSQLRFREGADGELAHASQGWVAPGGQHLVLRRAGRDVRLALNQDPPVNSCRPSVDVLFAAAAGVCAEGVLAVVLTGMGNDGLRGCERVREAGGIVLVQDEASSVVWSMPGAVAQAGLADQVLGLDQLGPEIVRCAGRQPTGAVAQVTPRWL